MSAKSIWKIFHMFMALGFPAEELKVVDTTIKMFTEPVLVGDRGMLAQVWKSENDRKQNILAELNVTAAELQSSDKFAKLLEAEGVEPETKEGKNGPIYAFAKTDQFMRDLLEDDSPRVRALAEARIGQKSTLLQTRAETLGWMASRGPMPVYLRYAGAHTTRWSGGDGCNWQNFKRGTDIRRAIMAPPGFLLAAIDLSQIECRIPQLFSWRRRMYREISPKRRSLHRNRISVLRSKFTKNRYPMNEELVSKLNYLAGTAAAPKSFKQRLSLGIYGPPVQLNEMESKHFVDLYRQTHTSVTAYWRQAENFLPEIAKRETFTWGPMTIRDRAIFPPKRRTAQLRNAGVAR